MTYRVTHKVTGETHTGSMRELAEVLGVSPTTISRAANDGKSLPQWTVDKLPKVKESSESKISPLLWDKWERQTEQFRRAKT